MFCLLFLDDCLFWKAAAIEEGMGWSALGRFSYWLEILCISLICFLYSFTKRIDLQAKFAKDNKYNQVWVDNYYYGETEVTDASA